MFFKERLVPKELQVYRMLRPRLEVMDEAYYWNLEKGYEGERQYDCWLESWKLPEWIVVNDLLLEHSRNVFQLDSLILTKERIYLFDVKNFEGDFFIEGERWFTLNKKEIKNQLLQLQRSETMLRKLLYDSGYNLPMVSNLIFVNPQFQLYQCPSDLPIIFHSQMERYKRKMLLECSGKCPTNHLRLAEKLVGMHMEDSPFSKFPQYEFDELRKGVFCLGCGGKCVRDSKYYLVCLDCEKKETNQAAVRRLIIEYLTLFPKGKLTSKVIYEWCGEVVSLKTISRVLNERYDLIGHGKSSKYTS
ncbi:Nuclease-related domain protein [Bacillus sp. THAF10]|uniref:nuclease-related domain-containing protein n=1 Tax=Bacillus sp. THAF10 TaxID=2587848 RepID=UPI0012685D55|nr:nuclease-related domain-containing protein [Bacillus sp. THAF10]QFT88098.1 Nuclease-related domain protein [Bacillus sp. THAF10]